MNKTYWGSLDGLRAFAVLIVLFSHAGFPYMKSGGVGVDIFFVLSGFLITTILSAEVETSGHINFLRFYIRRFLRLVPALVLTCVFFLSWTLVSEGHFPFKILLTVLTYTSNWARALFNFNLSSLGHTWSLGIEEQYYLLWPVVVSALHRWNKKNSFKAKVLFFATFILALYRYLMVSGFSAERIYFGLDTHMDGLVLGSALSFWIKATNECGGMTKMESLVLSYFFVPLAMLTFFIVMTNITWRHPLMGKLGYLGVACASFFLIQDLVMSPYSFMKKFFSLKPAVYIGRISYGLYLWHYPLYAVVNHFFPKAHFNFIFPLKITLSVIIASLSYYIIEVHFLKLKKKFEASCETCPRGRAI